MALRPGWQTEELEDEWVEQDVDDGDHDDDDDDDEDNLTFGSDSVSLTAPLPTEIRTHLSDDTSPSTTSFAGTFLIRQDIPAAQLLLKTPGRNKKGIIKDFFSPLPLERMFEPPTPPIDPPTNPSNYSTTAPPGLSEQESLTEAEGECTPEKAHKANMDAPFTFSVPRETSLKPTSAGTFPQAESTPGPPYATTGAPNHPPMTDPRLRLFHFQYDTFTRDHLSAIVDSIAVNSPSGGSGTVNRSPDSFEQGLSRVSEVTTSSHLRSAKRVKLSPRSDYYGESGGPVAVIARPKPLRKDYVGESQSLMHKIKQARDFSTISTVASANSSSREYDRKPSHHTPARRSSFLGVPDAHKAVSLSGGTTSTGSGPYSSSTYRQEAAALMAQIKRDMKGSKRLFSNDTEVSLLTHAGDKSSTNHSLSVHIRRPSLSEDKENRREHQRHHSRHTIKPSKPSPRKRHPSAADELDRELADKAANMALEEHLPTIAPSPDPVPLTTAHLAPPPPAYPTSSVRSGTNDDLNRFVSSSTASGTTLTAGSVPSFTKHPGPVQIRRIGPEDVPALPERVGKMVFDKVMMKWVKATALAATEIVEDKREYTGGTDGDSEDPFRDIESLREDDSGGRGGDLAMDRIEEQSEMDDEEEMELMSFSFDGPSGAVVQIMTGVETEDDQTTDSEDEEDVCTSPPETTAEHDQGSASEDDMPADCAQPSMELMGANFGTPQPPPGEGATPTIRSVLKSASATPTSALKDRSKYRTPVNRHGHRHRRSVSFSDGKRDGPIRGLGRRANVDDSAVADEFVPSARSKRIADLMDGLDDSDFDNDNVSPTKTSSSGRPATEELRPFAVREPTEEPPGSGSKSRRVLSRSPTHKGRGASANGTFLTECSFGVAHDRLVQVITDVQPFEPHWEHLSTMNLANKNVESVARLKEFLPRLNSLSLSGNQLSWLSGVPESVRTLSVASNNLTGITSYSHLRNLESLDISHNEIDSLLQLGCLRHLRELRADGNKIVRIDGIEKLDGLVKLSLQGNCIERADFKACHWARLEMLNLSHNRLESVRGLGSLPSLIALNIDHNTLKAVETSGSMGKLRILRASNNQLETLNVGAFPNLRTLYADNNSLGRLVKVNRLTKLENLSVRNQSGHGFNLSSRDIRDVKRLYLSGNPLKSGFLQEPCYNLIYLELAGCRLISLPANLARLVPNLRALNLNYNFLEDAKALEGLGRLKKLTVIGSRLKGTKALIRTLQRIPKVEMLDLRMNPCTLGWYLPVLVKGDVPPGGWHEMDAKFRQDLPDSVYMGRLAYRGLVMRACVGIRKLDGVEVTEKERLKADQILYRIVKG